MAQWYNQHLGIELTPAEYGQKSWSQEAGPTVFAPFPQDSQYFGDPQKQWMINFRVSDLDAMVEQLRAAKIDVAVDPETYPNGRFAHFTIRRETRSSSGNRSKCFLWCSLACSHLHRYNSNNR